MPSESLSTFVAHEFVRSSKFGLRRAIGITDATRERDGGVVFEDVAIKRIDSGIVDIGGQDAFAQVIKDHSTGNAAETTEGFFVQLSPDPGTGLEGE